MKNKRNVIALIIFNFGINTYWMVENFWINLYWTRNVDPHVYYVGLMVALSAVVGVLTQIFFGAFSDSCTSKYGRRRPFMLFAAITGGISMCFFPITRLFSIVIMAVIYGVIMDALITFFGDISTPTRLAFLTESTEIQERGTVNAIMGLTAAISTVLVVGFSGYIVDFAGPDFAFYYAGFLMIVCGIVFFIISREEPMKVREKTWKENFKETFTIESYRENKSLYILLFFLFINTIGVQIVAPFLFIYIETIFKLKGIELGIIIAALGLITLLLSFPAGVLVDKFGRKPIMIASTFGAAVFLILFSTIPIETDYTLFLVFLYGGLMTGFMAAISACADTWMQDLSPEDRRGSMLAYKIVAMVIPMVPGALIGGYLADNGPKPEGYLYSPIIFIVSAIFILISVFLLKNIEETLKKEKEIKSK
ncbi:MAG: MFS transporter [Promethearchaeia archaeon]